MRWVNHLKEKWNIRSNRDFILIMLVFSLAGMMIIHERRPVFHLLGVTEHTPFWLKVILYILTVFPLYQCNLLIFGFLLGQFEFFWAKEKQLVRFFARRLGIRS